VVEMANANKMREIRIDKVTLNIGAGEPGQKLENARTLLNTVSGRKPVTTLARVRSPTWKIRKGDQIGAKVTLRGADAEDLLKRALECVDKKLNASIFDTGGNFAFGVREYIDFPGVKYDPKIGIMGFDVCVTLKRRGARVVRRRRAAAAKVANAHKISADEARSFVSERYGVQFAE